MLGNKPADGQPKGAAATTTPPPAIGTASAEKVVVTPPTGPAKLDDVKKARVVSTDTEGRSLTKEPGDRTIIKQNNTVIIHRNETTVIQNYYPGAQTVRRDGGISETSYIRADGVRVFSEVDQYGRLVRRWGVPPRGGRDIIFVDNRRHIGRVAAGVGVGVLIGVGIALALQPPVVTIPRERYIVDYNRASDDDIYDTLVARPVMKLDRGYSLDEVRYSAPLRDRMPRIDLDSITFDTGSFTITEDQYPKLQRIAKAIARALEKNPAEMFLIEGHTDAVGASEDNVSLSDRRAEAVSKVLVEYFNIPLENLTAQGYGEQYLKISSDGPERVNRRVAMRRITPLLSGEQQ